MKGSWQDAPLMVWNLAASDSHDISLWEVAHSAPMEVPWPSGTCPDHPHI